jgi:hypothetical protein
VLLTQGVGFFLGTQLSGAFVNTYGVDGNLSLEDWQLFWGIFAGATFLFALFFFFLFNDEVSRSEPVEPVEPHMA